MGVHVTLDLQAKPDSLEKLKTTFQNILPDTRSFEGCQSVVVLGNQDDSCNVVLYEIWDTREHQEKYLGWREETGALAALAEMLTQPPVISYYDDLGI